jgi:hypothetical protein
MRADFAREGADIGRVSDALSLVRSSEPLDAAVPDIHLVANALEGRRISPSFS